MKNSEIGLQHIQNLGITRASSMEEIVKKISKITGNTDFAYSLLGSFFNDKQSMIYDKKNANYDISMIVTGSYDADIVRKACNWIAKNKEFFGSEILEIGCDCGFITTFLASVFPESHITAIDRNISSINIAKKNVEKLGLSNVSFECCDVADINKVYETVFSMRTMHENLEEKLKVNIIDDFQIQGKEYKKGIETYAKSIGKILSENGRFISIERCERDPLFLGWIDALFENRIFADTDSYEELECKEVGDLSKFQALCFFKKEKHERPPYGSFQFCVIKKMDTTLAQYDGWEARLMFDVIRGESLKEIYLKNKDNQLCGRYSCWTHCSDSTTLVFFQDNGDNPVLGLYDIDQKEEIIAVIQNTMRAALEAGFIVQ